MLIPRRELSQEALQGLVEEFVSRDGTDYGEEEIPLAVKVAQVKTLLERGQYVILYDLESQSAAIVPKEQVLDDDEDD